MKIGHTHSAIRATGRALTLRRVEKSGGSSGLHEKHERRAGRTLTYSGRDRRAGTSRIDTGSSRGQARNGMPAGFVAQVLGQVLETKPENPMLATRVYARSARTPKDGRLIRVL
jgi:hypothetical protein